MTQIATLRSINTPALVASAGERAGIRFLEFFAVGDPQSAHAPRVCTRRGGLSRVVRRRRRAVDHRGAAAACGQPGSSCRRRRHSAPTVKQRLAAIRHLFDWLVTGQIVPYSPAASVRGPAHTTKKGKTPVLDATEARQLLDSIDVTTPVGLRDRALIALMVFSFARVGAALAMRVDDVYMQQRRLWVRLREKGGKRHEMPCHHTLEAYLHDYLEQTGLRDEPKGPLFRTIARGTGQLSSRPLPQANAYAMVRRRATRSRH